MIVQGGEPPRLFSNGICQYIQSGFEHVAPEIDEVPDREVRNSLVKVWTFRVQGLLVDHSFPKWGTMTPNGVTAGFHKYSVIVFTCPSDLVQLHITYRACTWEKNKDWKLIYPEYFVILSHVFSILCQIVKMCIIC